MSNTQKTVKIAFWIVSISLVIFAAVMFNVWLADGCRAGSGVITWHGKECALK